MVNGYSFYFKTDSKVITFPITPGELTISVGSKNEVVTLINEGDINILKSPSLIEVEFEARFPMRKYPYSKVHRDFQMYFDEFKKLKENKKSFRFIVARYTSKKLTWDTNLLVSLEDMTIKESADEGDDVLISFKLKQYKSYGVKTISTSGYKKNTPSRDTKEVETSQYTVKSGDNLYNISKKYYGKGEYHPVLFEANTNVIESTAKEYGKNSSSNGHWIYPGTKLTIPSSKKVNLSGGGGAIGSYTALDSMSKVGGLK